MNLFSSKEGEIAAAILSVLPKRMEFIESTEKVDQDLWMRSRFDWLDMLDLSGTHKWIK
jgi:hypothetical protein